MKIQQFDYSANLSQALIWHFNKAQRLESLVLQKQLWYDINQSLFWEEWFNTVFNLLTANDFGCAVWSLILGMPIFLTHHEAEYAAFGFGPDNENFDHAPFGVAGSEHSQLTLTEKRILLRLRYCQLTSRGDIPTTNRQLNMIFGNHRRVFVLENFGMSITCVFKFDPGTRLLRAIKEFDLIPRCDGVLIDYNIEIDDVFGFDQYNVNFDNAAFVPEE